MTVQRVHKKKVDFGIAYFYRKFILERNYDIPQKQYTLILKTFFQVVVEKIIKDGFRFWFPGIGLFYLISNKQKFITEKSGKVRLTGSIDWPATKELQKRTGDRKRVVRFVNDHTDKKIYRIYWDKSSVDFTNKIFYTFVINRNHKKTLHDVIMSLGDINLNAYKLWYQ